MVSKMAGLSDKERIGCAKLLSLMPESDVRSLCETVTSKKIQVETTRAAIEAIVSYSNDAAELFKRRKVHRDIIFKYLAKEGIVMPIHCDKTLLVKRTLEFWSSGKIALTQQITTPHGHRFISSPHGLVLVAVAGTIHRDNCWLGIFEQVFGLICTPMENTWKIKFTDLRVRGAGTQDGAEGMSPTVTCDFDELQRQHRS
uniref:Chromosome 3 open reading frame 38 n=1 Tax=Gadus morhua TaxID=8049 RepID=A0A8C5FKR9_GADMO